MWTSYPWLPWRRHSMATSHNAPASSPIPMITPRAHALVFCQLCHSACVYRFAC
jgi:hypothetical protein